MYATLVALATKGTTERVNSPEPPAGHRRASGRARGQSARLVHEEEVGAALLGIVLGVVAERVEVVRVRDTLDGHEADVPRLVLLERGGGKLWGERVEGGTGYYSARRIGG